MPQTQVVDNRSSLLYIVGGSSAGQKYQYAPDWTQENAANRPYRLWSENEIKAWLLSEHKKAEALILAAQQERLAQEAISRTAEERSATNGSSILTKAMEALQVGDSIPVVFGRRRTGGTGGIFVQPKATEVQITNTATTITVRWHCVLSDGDVQSAQVRDVRNGFSRQGQFSQNYNKRAGTWEPGIRTRKLTSTELPAFPLQAGGGGTYSGLSTIEFSNTYPIDSQRWSQSWSVFLRGGLIIDRGRLIDGVVGPSDNICDLVIWAITRSGLMTEDQINIPAMEKAALFIEANELYCNAEFTASQSLPDFLSNILPLFLLRETRIDGKYALIPLLPVNADGTINTDTLVADYVFTEDVIVPDSYSEQPAPAANRRPLQIVATYRQQTSDIEPPLVCTLPVGIEGEQGAASEELRLDGVCTSRIHAATAAGYRHAVRTLAGGAASVGLRPGGHTGNLQPGALAQILLRSVSQQEEGWLSSWWLVTSVSMDGDANQTAQLAEVPVDSEGRSIVAQQVAAARAAAGNLIFPYPVISEDDEPGRSTDTSVPAESTPPAPPLDRGDRDSGEGDVKLPPPPPPGAPPRSDGSPFSGGSGGPVERANDPPRDRNGGRRPNRDTRWPPARCSGRNQAFMQLLEVWKNDGAEWIKMHVYGPAIGIIIVTEEERRLNFYGPNLNYVVYRVHHQPCSLRADGSINVISKSIAPTIFRGYGGPYADGSMRSDFDFRFIDSCADASRVSG